MFTENTVTIITATTGHRRLQACLNSVQSQTFPGVEHLVVIDGFEHEAKVRAAVSALNAGTKPVRVMTLPLPTGKDNWCGHRIYGAMSFLVNTEFVCYLDEDNWIEPEHVETLVAAVRQSKASWAFSLRKIVDANGQFIALDNCESLGHLHHVFNDRNDFLIDTNCYLLSRAIAVACAPVWYGPTRPPSRTMEPDRVMCRTLLHHFPPFCSNLRHTLNYVVGNRPDSVKTEYFLEGNLAMLQTYPQGLPWLKSSRPS
jgi:hypothetical protein